MEYNQYTDSQLTQVSQQNFWSAETIVASQHSEVERQRAVKVLANIPNDQSPRAYIQNITNKIVCEGLEEAAIKTMVTESQMSQSTAQYGQVNVSSNQEEEEEESNSWGSWEIPLGNRNMTSQTQSTRSDNSIVRLSKAILADYEAGVYNNNSDEFRLQEIPSTAQETPSMTQAQETNFYLVLNGHVEIDSRVLKVQSAFAKLKDFLNATTEINEKSEPHNIFISIRSLARELGEFLPAADLTTHQNTVVMQTLSHINRLYDIFKCSSKETASTILFDSGIEYVVHLLLDCLYLKDGEDALKSMKRYDFVHVAICQLLSQDIRRMLLKCACDSVKESLSRLHSVETMFSGGDLSGIFRYLQLIDFMIMSNAVIDESEVAYITATKTLAATYTPFTHVTLYLTRLVMYATAKLQKKPT